MIVMTISLLLTLSFIFNNIQKAAIVVTVIYIFFFSYSSAYDAFSGRRFLGMIVEGHRVFFPLWSALSLLVVAAVVFALDGLELVTVILNLTSFILLFIPVSYVVVKKLSEPPKEHNDHTVNPDASLLAGLKNKTVKYPDIYYIILDAYGNQAVLNEVYGYDNSPFVNALAAKGFCVAPKSKSNYSLTFLSLASALNMEYLNYLTETIGEESNQRLLLYQMIKKNKVATFLKSKGYIFAHFSSGWGATEHNKYADINFRNGGISNEFAMAFIKKTMIRPFEKYIIGNSASQRVLYTFDKLGELPNICGPGPVFAFAHFLVPHPPYLFGKNQKGRSTAQFEIDGSVWSSKEDYLEQLQFVNGKVEVLVDRILANSRVPPIIIAQADHGPASSFGGCWPQEPTQYMLKERMGILNAVFLPDGAQKVFYEGITPVNTFRLIFDKYFGCAHGLLEDKSYYSSYDQPYKFVHVND